MALIAKRRWVLPLVTLGDPPAGIPGLVARIMAARQLPFEGWAAGCRLFPDVS